MATRSNIAMRLADGKIRVVYCHWDGYPEHHWPILTQHYNTLEKVTELLSHGSISSLGRRCDKPEGHSFENPVEDCTVYYGRDRGESNQEAQVVKKTQRWFEEEYGYLFDNGEWVCYTNYTLSSEEVAKLGLKLGNTHIDEFKELVSIPNLIEGEDYFVGNTTTKIYFVSIPLPYTGGMYVFKNVGKYNLIESRIDQLYVKYYYERI